MEYICDFARSVVIFLLLVNVGESLINTENNKKLYRLFTGLVLIIIVLNTVIKFKGITVDKFFITNESEEKIEELEMQINSKLEKIEMEYENSTLEMEYESSTLEGGY